MTRLHSMRPQYRRSSKTRVAESATKVTKAPGSPRRERNPKEENSASETKKTTQPSPLCEHLSNELSHTSKHGEFCTPTTVAATPPTATHIGAARGLFFFSTTWGFE